MGARQIVTKPYHVPSTPPAADFTSVPRAGIAPLAVLFTDASTDALLWSWDFGDESSGSHAKNLAHIYTTGRSFNVTLVATNVFGTTTSRRDNYITVGAFVSGLPATYYGNQAWNGPSSTRTDTRIRFAAPTGVAAEYPTDEAGWPNSTVG